MDSVEALSFIMALINLPVCVVTYLGVLKLQTDETSTAEERDTVKRNINILKVILTVNALFSIIIYGDEASWW